MGYKELLEQNEYFKNINLDYAMDTLTNVLNRESIIKYVHYLIACDKKFTLIILDIDNFKHINDSYGHMVGDIVLSKASQCFCDIAENKGIVGRFGGDEFILIFENVDEYNEVWEIGHKLNVEISSILFKEANNSIVTITCGMTRFPLDGSSYDEIITKADKALYRGKTKGRNCFIIYLPYKHDKLQLARTSDPANSALSVHMKLFDYLENESLTQGIEDLFKYLLSTFMFDHICIQVHNELYYEFTHDLSKNKDFKAIPTAYIKELENKGVAYINDISNLDLIGKVKLKNALDEQKEIAAAFFTITAYNKYYGMIRVDQTNIRMWQDNELNVLATVARLIGLILHDRNIQIKDIKK